MMAISSLPLLLLLLGAAAIFRGILIATTAPRRGSKVPCCEKCRYPVAGLTTFSCPECGTDLRATGIITRPMEIRRRGSMFSAILGLTFLCILLGLIAAYFIAISSMGFMGGAGGGGPTTMSTTLTPTSSAYTSIVVEQDTSSIVFADLKLMLNDGSERHLILTNTGASSPSYSIKDGAGVDIAIGTFADDTASQWLEKSGINVDDPTVAEEAKEITRLVDSMMVNPWNPPSSVRRVSKLKVTSGPTYSSGAQAVSPASWISIAYLLAFAIPFALWVFGIIFIIFRRRKLLREATAADAAAAGPILVPGA